MALRPTIYKFHIALSDLDRHYYAALNLTVAQHPSEKIERVMARLLAYCLNAGEGLEFSKGLSEPDEPDVWTHALDGRLTLWVDVGEPAFDRLKKASRLGATVKVYSFNTKCDVWWAQNRDKLTTLPISIYQFAWPSIQALAALTTRVMDMSVTISGDCLHVAAADGGCEVMLVKLQ